MMKETVLICLIVLVAFIFGALWGMKYEAEKITESLEQYFSILYETEIFPKGEKAIQDFVIELDQSLNETEKFDKIAEWVTANFTEYYWEKGLINNTKYEYNGYSPFVDAYVYDPDGRVRACPPSPYSNDPAWIAYYRTGACGELATLFADIANRTKTPVKLVQASFKTHGNHAWVEVMLENGEWRYFDPTIYGEHSQFGIWPDGHWFGNISNYHINRPKNIIGIYETKTKKEVTYRYPLMQYRPEVKDIFTIFKDLKTNTARISLFHSGST